MLSDSERTAFLASIERVRQSVAGQLRSIHDAPTAIAFVANLHRAVDKVAASGPQVDCRTGCTPCCTLRVEATEPEIFRIAGVLRQRPAAQLNALLERLRHRVAANHATPSPRADCAFLDNQLCSIYEVRPAVCRKAHSLSVERCKEWAAEIPQDLERVLAAEALIQGTSQAYRDVRLCASARELCRVVLLALTDETAEARWYAGESVFPDA